MSKNVNDKMLLFTKNEYELHCILRGMSKCLKTFFGSPSIFQNWILQFGYLKIFNLLH